jgi:transcriptional regulator with XRE-family HTH domain
VQYAQLSNNIKTLCKSYNVSVKKLLEDCNIRKSFIYDIEKRGCAPAIDTLNKIADYFNVSIDYLLGITDIKEKPTADESDELDNTILNLIKYLSDDEKDAVYRVINSMIEGKNKE